MKQAARIISEAEALAEVREVYGELAARSFERSCISRTECCRFKLTGRVPHLTRGEALVAARAWRATGRKTLPARDAADGACPLLDERNGRCMIYDSRPFGCRTHFCRAAGGNLERNDVVDLVRRLEKVDAALGGEGARPLPDAVAAALAQMR